jgi:hypothetical protein
MHQQSLLDDATSEPGRGLVGIFASTLAMTPAQRKFNQLIERIKLQRQELDDWRVFRQRYQQQLADHHQPAMARLLEKQIAMVRWLDRTMDGKALSKRERAKTRDIIFHLLSQLLAESQDAELVLLHDKYAPRSFSDQHDDLELLRTLASDAFGVDVGSYTGSASPEELAEWLDEQLRAGEPEPQASSPRKKSAKSRARDALREQSAQGATRAVREVFRKLASELHPDRETDPAEHARKTELMQRVNQAYKAGDLLALLELQLSIEQINPKALADLADEKLRHYVHVLEEQSRRLSEELAELVAPFAMAIGDSTVRKLSPAIVQQALQVDIHHVKALARTLEADLVRFQDIQNFKRSLRDYEIDPIDDTDFGVPREFRRRRRRRRR